MNTQLKFIGIFLIGIILGGGLLYLFSNYTIQKKNESTFLEKKNQNNSSNNKQKEKIANSQSDSFTTNSKGIDQLTDENTVIPFVKKNRKLPDYYLTKSEAKKVGWVPSQGNLCEVAPGRAIGGDRFSNREKTLPRENQYYEADVNYQCGRRNADRIVFTDKGEVWITHDHYRSFTKK